MNLKKFISGVSALAIAASAFAGITAMAADPVVVYERGTSETTAWSNTDISDWTGHAPSITANGLTGQSGTGNRTATKSIAVDDGALLQLDMVYYTGDSFGDSGNYTYFNLGNSISIRTSSQAQYGKLVVGTTEYTIPNACSKSNGNRGAEDWTISMTVDTTLNKINSVSIVGTNGTTPVNYVAENLAFPTSATFDSIAIGSNRAASNVGNEAIKSIKITQQAQEVETAEYTVKYVDTNGNSIKEDYTGVGAVNTKVSVDTNSFVAEGGQKYFYVSDDSASNAIKADGSTVVTITYRAAATYSYTVKADQGDIVIASGSGFEGDTVKVAYPRYINVDGTLYERGATNKEYNHTFTLDENNKEVTLAYTATEISNVVFLAEGEDIDGLTASNAANTKIRSSKSGAAYATEDTTITTLPAGKYVIYAVVYSGSSAGANLPFTLGANEFALATEDNSNWVDLNTAEFEISEDTDLVMKAGGGNAAALDFIYVVKTGDYVAPAPNLGALVTEQETVNGTEDYADEAATWFIITVANTGDAVGTFNTVSITDGTKTGTYSAPNTTINAGAEIVYGGVVEGAYTFTDASVD